MDRFRLELEDWVRSGTNRLELEDWARSGTNRLQLDDWDFWVVCDFSPQKNPTWTGLVHFIMIFQKFKWPNTKYLFFVLI